MSNKPVLISVKQLSEYLPLSTSTICKLTPDTIFLEKEGKYYHPDIPPLIKVRNRIHFDISDVNNFIDAGYRHPDPHIREWLNEKFALV